MKTDAEITDRVFNDIFDGMENPYGRLRITDSTDKAKIIANVYEFAHSFIDSESNEDSFARDYAYSYLAQVNWSELAARVVIMVEDEIFNGNTSSEKPHA